MSGDFVASDMDLPTLERSLVRSLLRRGSGAVGPGGVIRGSSLIARLSLNSSVVIPEEIYSGGCAGSSTMSCRREIPPSILRGSEADFVRLQRVETALGFHVGRISGSS